MCNSGSTIVFRAPQIHQQCGSCCVGMPSALKQPCIMLLQHQRPICNFTFETGYRSWTYDGTTDLPQGHPCNGQQSMRVSVHAMREAKILVT